MNDYDATLEARDAFALLSEGITAVLNSASARVLVSGDVQVRLKGLELISKMNRDHMNRDLDTLMREKREDAKMAASHIERNARQSDST